jgi:hypothetical protein
LKTAPLPSNTRRQLTNISSSLNEEPHDSYFNAFGDIVFHSKCTIMALPGFKALQVDLQKCPIDPVRRHYDMIYNCLNGKSKRSDKRGCKFYYVLKKEKLIV